MQWNDNQDSRKKGILQYATTWMKLEDMMLSKISQSQDNKYYMIPPM